MYSTHTEGRKRNSGVIYEGWGTRWRSSLRHSASSRKVAGSIPDVVIGILNRHNPSGRTKTQGLTQTLPETGSVQSSCGVALPCLLINL